MTNISILLGISLLVASPAWGNEVAIQTIVLEAQGESLEGQIAVGEVIRARAMERGWEAGYRPLKPQDSIEAVCLAPYQFSCWNNRQEAQKRLKRVSGEVWQRASRAWEESGRTNLTKGARHYHSEEVSPRWAKGKRASARIGRHIFYNNIN